MRGASIKHSSLLEVFSYVTAFLMNGCWVRITIINQKSVPSRIIQSVWKLKVKSWTKKPWHQLTVSLIYFHLQISIDECFSSGHLNHVSEFVRDEKKLRKFAFSSLVDQWKSISVDFLLFVRLFFVCRCFISFTIYLGFSWIPACCENVFRWLRRHKQLLHQT